MHIRSRRLRAQTPPREQDSPHAAARPPTLASTHRRTKLATGAAAFPCSACRPALRWPTPRARLG
eukprot:1163300-Prymnesium_polylepis.2